MVQEARSQLKPRLTGLFYYTGEGRVGAPREDRFSVFLCGAVGYLADKGRMRRIPSARTGGRLTALAR